MSTSRFAKSEALLARALAVIPGGTQTFSKSRTQFPVGASPLYAERAEGYRLWDVDGNVYLDFINGLLSISLGYRDPDVDAAVREQLERGVTLSLPMEIEIELAETIAGMVPSAEMVRFAKNGSDATAGAIRAARAFTGRERIAICGYHGWQDWYIGTTTRDLGVPKAVKSLGHRFSFNDLDSLETLLASHPGEFAAIILEPMNLVEPAPGFLEGVRDAATRAGALLVFDEIITGFRFALGGAQSLFGVTPDLTAMGKGIANGYPLSVLAGRADVMQALEKAFFSFTMGSEAISLAAARATLAKLSRPGLLDAIHDRGREVQEGARALIAQHGLESVMSCVGHPSWSFMVIGESTDYDAWALRTLWLQEILARGVLSFGSHNMTHAHDEAAVAGLLAVYDEALFVLADAVKAGDISDRLHCDTLRPLFRVR